MEFLAKPPKVIPQAERRPKRYWSPRQGWLVGLTLLVMLAATSLLPASATTLIATIPVGSSPVEVGVNSTTNRVYVANGNSSNVSVIDGTTNSVVATIPVGSNPVEVGVNSTTNRVYVSNRNSNNVSVIDGTTNSVVATTTVGSLPYGVGVNSTTNRVYVANRNSNNVSVLGELDPSSTSLSSSPNPSQYSQNVTFTASVTPITATGTVTFKFDGSTSVTQTVSGGAASYVTSTLSVGQHTVVATYNGDSNLAASTSTTLTQTVTAGPPAQVATVSGSGQSTTISTTFGAPLVAKVTDAGSNPVSGTTVTFTAPATGPSGTFAGDLATYTGTTDASGTVTTTTFTANTKAGAYVVSATVSGVATPASFNLTNTPGPAATITAVSGTPQSAAINTPFSAPLVAKVTDAGSNPVGSQTVNFTAPSTGPSGTFAGGSATYVGTTDASGTVTSTTFTANGQVGSYTVSATDGGAANLTASARGLAAPASFSLTNTAGSSSLVLTSSPNPSTFGQSVTFQADVTPSDASGTVTFTEGTTVLGTASVMRGSASFSTSSLSGGSHVITATFTDGSTYTGSTSNAVTQVVNPASTTTTLVGSPTSIVAGQSVTFTATVSPVAASGTVTFTDGTTVLGTATLSGGTAVFSTTSLALGNRTVTATYAGDTNYASSTSNGVSVTVTCNPYVVSSSADDGSCGTLRAAVTAASTGPTKTVTIALPAGSVISLTSGITLTNNVAITTTATCGSGGPSITIQGSGVASGDGLTLGGTNRLYNLWVRGFSGRQIVAPAGSHTIMQCVRATKVLTPS